MKKIYDLNYDNVPGIKDSFKLFIKSLLRKFVKNPMQKFRDFLVDWRLKICNRELFIEIEKVSRDADSNIPKILHYVWVGGNPKPESVLEYIESWRKFCPDYLIIEWNEANYDVKKNPFMKQAYENKKWAFVSDYMRLDILEKFGGVYLDSDVEILKNIDVFLDEPAFTSFEAGNPDQIMLPTGMIGAEKANAWIKYLKSYYDNRNFLMKNGEFDLTANTITISNMTTEKYGVILNNKKQQTDDFVLYPSEYFCPKSWSTRQINITENSYTIHHFAGSWLPEKINK